MGTSKIRLLFATLLQHYMNSMILTHKAQITTAIDDTFCDIIPKFRKKISHDIFHENRLPADDSHEISCLIFFIF